MEQQEVNKVREQGMKKVRDSIIAAIIGLQNGIGKDSQSEAYLAYQKVLEYVESEFGEFMRPISVKRDSKEIVNVVKENVSYAQENVALTKIMDMYGTEELLSFMPDFKTLDVEVHNKKEDNEIENYLRTHIDVEAAKTFAKYHVGCCSLYRTWATDVDFYCLDISYEKDTNSYWFGLGAGDRYEENEHVEYLFQSEDINLLTRELILEYQDMWFRIKTEA